MHRSHLPRWFALVIALFSFQCLDSLSDDCRKTRTCETAPQLGEDCRWHYPDGGIWGGGPHLNDNGLWVWPNGTLTKTQSALKCGTAADAGALGDGGLEPGTVDNCPEIPCDEGLQCELAAHRCVKCLDSSQCADSSDPSRGQTHACDPRAHVCVVCLNDGDCGTLHCKTDANPDNNRCVECVPQKDHCTGDEVCDPGSNRCTSTCSGPGQCKPPKGICSDPVAGLCVGCIANGDCSGATPQCNTMRKECVQCVDNVPCTNPAAPVCSPGNRCVECVDGTTCRDEGRRVCDPVASSCVACLDSSQCTARDKSRCNALHECAPCTDNGQCESDAPVCNTSTGRCVACIDDSTCTAGSLCDTATGTCVGCLGNDDCIQDASLARCNVAARVCEPCTPTSTQCVGKFGVKNLCNNNGECVQCTGNLDCAADATKSRCDATGLCAGCRLASDCSVVAGKHACTGGNNGRCVECLNSTDCASNANGLACNTTNNTCVECVADTDCKTAGASRCVSNQCQACVNDGGGSHCGHITSGATALAVCDTSAGAAAGVCVQCTGTQRAACGANVCNSSTKVCSPFAVGSAGLCEDCVSDAHCPSTQRCVQETFGTSPLGFSCFPLAQAGDCPLTPFSGLTTVSTIDNPGQAMCLLRRTTCAGFNQANNKPCSINADCGEVNQDDGRCDIVGGVCTLPCTSGVDCPSGDNASCLGGVCQL
jgi:hypothetical protein